MPRTALPPPRSPLTPDETTTCRALRVRARFWRPALVCRALVLLASSATAVAALPGRNGQLAKLREVRGRSRERTEVPLAVRRRRQGVVNGMRATFTEDLSTGRSTRAKTGPPRNIPTTLSACFPGTRSLRPAVGTDRPRNTNPPTTEPPTSSTRKHPRTRSPTTAGFPHERCIQPPTRLRTPSVRWPGEYEPGRPSVPAGGPPRVCRRNEGDPRPVVGEYANTPAWTPAIRRT
jgi:hypothetical protein